MPCDGAAFGHGTNATDVCMYLIALTADTSLQNIHGQWHAKKAMARPLSHPSRLSRKEAVVSTRKQQLTQHTSTHLGGLAAADFEDHFSAVVV